MRVNRNSLIFLVTTVFATINANAIICLPDEPDSRGALQFSAINCSYFAGSKALKFNRNGSLYNFNQEGDYQDQLSGNSFVFCPIVGALDSSDIVATKIAVADLNQKQDVVCQMGQSQYRTTGFSAYWGSTSKSKHTGNQTITTANTRPEMRISNSSTFISCSLPPQDNQNENASALMAYTVMTDKTL